MGGSTAAAVAEHSSNASLNALRQGSDLGVEAKRSTHILLSSFDRTRRGLEVLHRDLFDLDNRVVGSALQGLAKLKDPRSLNFIGRLLGGTEAETVQAAVRAFGEIGHPKAAKVLLDLYKISKEESLRVVILEALGRIRPGDAHVVSRIEEYSRSKMVRPETRKAAIQLLLRSGVEVDLEAILEGAKEEIVETVLEAALDSEPVAEQAFGRLAGGFGRLSAVSRCLMIDLAAKGTLGSAAEVLKQGLGDVDAAVRRRVYDQLGEHEGQGPLCGVLVSALSEGIDADPNLEEEALAGIQRLEGLEAGKVAVPVRKRILEYIDTQFKIFSTPDRQVGSDSHELGWLISRSREYLEFYSDEDFRQALLHYLRGSGYYTREKILMELKATAVKVEVRHFDGYKALVDVINNPKRPGIGLISRELAIAKLGRRRAYYRLIRNLRLSRLVDAGGFSAETLRLFGRIYAWARQMKLFRLAEAAFYALARRDGKKATELGTESLQPPVFSKICAIGTIRLLRELDWQALQPGVVKLLWSCEDPHVLLNLVDALASSGLPMNDEVVTGMVTVLREGRDEEVVHRVAEFLAAHSPFRAFEPLIQGFEQAEPWRRRLVLTILQWQIMGDRVSNREGLVEFLYRVLRLAGGEHQAQAAVLLWRLGDDYAGKVLKEAMLSASAEQRIDILRSLSGSLAPELIPAFLPLLRSEHPGLQEALRECLGSAEGQELQGRICDLALAVRGDSGLEAELEEESGEVEVQVELFKEKKAYRFEREYVQELAVLFADIQGYSKKAQALSTMQLTALIQDYEGILLPIMNNHRGELIKKMGDGHLVVFAEPLNAALAAIRVQKALKRFNSYREQNQRIVIRIGIHWGKVVRKEGDVIGNHVNIASRMESSAKGGSILISEAVQQRLGGYIHSREVGLISVKGISEPIKAYEPYEIVVEFPPELDPLKNRHSETRDSLRAGPQQPPAGGGGQEAPGNGGAAGPSGNGHRKAVVLERETLRAIAEAFSSLNSLCRRAEAGQTQVGEIRKELAVRWRGINAKLKQGSAL